MLPPHAIFGQGVPGTDTGVFPVLAPEGRGICVASAGAPFFHARISAKPKLTVSENIVHIFVVPKEADVLASELKDL